MSKFLFEPGRNLQDQQCLRARSNLEMAIKTAARLPQNVFQPGWGSFYLFNSDWMFEGAFVEKIRIMLQQEGSSCACIVNLDRAASDTLAAFAIKGNTSAQEYQRLLAGTGPSDGWVYDVDRFGCTSEIGTWCIYCERASELAILGFNVETLEEKHEFVRAALHASGVSSIGLSPSRFEFASHIISQEWQVEITRNYKHGA
jgi:hypothetical protein